jgi:PEGA domain
MSPPSRAARWVLWLTPYVAMLGGLALLLMLALSLTRCASGVGRPAVSLRIERAPRAPRDASVLIDEEYIGPLAYVAAHGVRLPIGEHRISVEKPGYFPWDKRVVADREPIFLKVELDPVPD